MEDFEQKEKIEKPQRPKREKIPNEGAYIVCVSSIASVQFGGRAPNKVPKSRVRYDVLKDGKDMTFDDVI